MSSDSELTFFEVGEWPLSITRFEEGDFLLQIFDDRAPLGSNFAVLTKDQASALSDFLSGVE